MPQTAIYWWVLIKITLGISTTKTLARSITKSAFLALGFSAVIRPMTHSSLPAVVWLPVILMAVTATTRSEEHTSELQSRGHLVCRLLLEKKKVTSRHEK